MLKLSRTRLQPSSCFGATGHDVVMLVPNTMSRFPRALGRTKVSSSVTCIRRGDSLWPAQRPAAPACCLWGRPLPPSPTGETENPCTRETVLPTNAATNSDSAQECRRGSIIPALAAADCDGVLSVFLVQFADIHEPDTAPCGGTGAHGHIRPSRQEEEVRVVGR